MDSLEKCSGKCLDPKMSEQPLASATGQFDGMAVPVVGDLVQLVPPFPKMVRIEVSAILKSLNLAGNSMTCEAAFRLLDFVCVSPTGPSVMMEASMIRAACKPSGDSDDMHII